MKERTPEQAEHLKKVRKELDMKIQEYQEALSPGEMVLDWVLLTQRSSMELAQSSKKAFGIATAEGQSFIATRGLLEIGVDLERADMLRAFSQ